MGQQPNIEVEESDLPAPEADRGAERRWTPTRPGEISSPADVPTGASFGRPGPDPGWAMRLLARTAYDRGDRPRPLAALLATLVGARASFFGRCPTPQDVEVVLTIGGLRAQDMDKGSLTHLASCREAWIDAVAHEVTPGMAALEAIPRAILVDLPVRIRARLNAQPDLVG